MRAACAKFVRAFESNEPEAQIVANPFSAYLLMTARCGRRDIATAHGLFLGLTARREFDRIFVWYFNSLSEIADTDGKRKLLIPAAAVVALAEIHGTKLWTDGVPPDPDDPELTALSQKMREAVEGAEPALSLEIVHLLAEREFETRSAENHLLSQTVRNLRRLKPIEGEYW